MDCPPIQYCRTVDGVNIAYWTLGEGPTVAIVEDAYRRTAPKRLLAALEAGRA